MKSLKVLVVTMGLMIVVGLGFLGYGVTRNLGSVPGRGGGETPSSGLSAVEQGYFNVDLPLGADAKLEQMAVSNDRVILRFSGADGERLVVLDPKTGHLSGTVTLVPQKP